MRLKADVKQEHLIQWDDNVKRKVTCYHGWRIKKLPPTWAIKAVCLDDGAIESAENTVENFYGIMWHPEREMEPLSMDIEYFCSRWRT